MHWPYENRAYQVAAVDGLAIFYGVESDGMSLRGQSFDLSAEELDQSLRVGGFRLADVAATPDGQTPFIGDFMAVNGSRQLVGLDLIAAAVESGRTKRVVDAGSVLSRALDGALRGGFRHRDVAVDDSQDAAPDGVLREPASVDAHAAPAEGTIPAVFQRDREGLGESSGEDGVCPYLRKREADSDAAASVTPSGSESAVARDYRCVQAQGMLVMTVARLNRLCQGGGFAQCRHYRYVHQRELEPARPPSA